MSRLVRWCAVGCFTAVSTSAALAQRPAPGGSLPPGWIESPPPIRQPQRHLDVRSLPNEETEPTTPTPNPNPVRRAAHFIADEGMKPADGTMPESTGGTAVAPPSADVTASLNQRIVIRPEESAIKEIKPEHIIVDRPELFLPYAGKDENAATIPFRIRPDGRSIELKGIRLGKAKIRIFDPEKPESKPYSQTVLVVPDAEYLNRLVASRFPNANVRVTPAGDNFLLLDGYVEHPGDVEAISGLLDKYFSLKTIENVRVLGIMQVQLEVVIARVDRSELRRLGVNSLVNSQYAYFGTQVGSLLAAPNVTLPTAGSKVFAPLGGGQAPLTSSSTAFFGITDASTGIFGFIEALRQHNLAKILSNPTLVTYSGRQADFLVGGEQPVPVSGTLGNVNVQFKPFGTRLTFLPTVLGNGKIRLDVVPEVSSINFNNSITTAGLQIPQFIVQRLHATVELQAGQTLCLGGLLQTEVEAQAEKIPLLGELPWVGTLFRRVRHRTTESELLVMVTPKLFDPASGCTINGPLPGRSTRNPTDGELFTRGALEAVSLKAKHSDDLPRLGDGLMPTDQLPPAKTKQTHGVHVPTASETLFGNLPPAR